jgi:hypothetical protein
MDAKGIVYLPNHFGTNYRIIDAPTVSTSYSKKHLLGRIKGFNETFNLLKEFKKEEYFPFIFRHIREFWINVLFMTDVQPIEKKELLKKAAFIFEEFKKYDVDIYIEKRFIPLFNEINNKQFDKAILISDILKDSIEEEQKLKNEINRLSFDNNQLTLVNIELKRQLDVKENEMAEYLPIYGYLKYKLNNVITRIINKLKK